MGKNAKQHREGEVPRLPQPTDRRSFSEKERQRKEDEFDRDYDEAERSGRNKKHEIQKPDPRRPDVTGLGGDDNESLSPIYETVPASYRDRPTRRLARDYVRKSGKVKVKDPVWDGQSLSPGKDDEIIDDEENKKKPRNTYARLARLIGE